MMQVNPAYPVPARALGVRRPWMSVAVLAVLLVLGLAVGFLAAKAGMKAATLNVALENRTAAAQDFAVFLNGAQVASAHLAPGQTTSFAFPVEWSGSANGMYEVRAVAALGGVDDERVTVGNGQTAFVHLQVG